ncbi:MAG: TonB-dependent receptor [Flammeovirgaceae bacterium]|jgi:TonB-linked SusC/RagA family outer membrane protein|nr:TonB-dependent receptor [Flammeovirgaceae bacterium]
MRENLLKQVFALFLSVSALVAFAQERTITGRVTAAEDGSAVPGANILVKGTTNGTVTDVNGNFTLEVPSGATLIVSFVGLKTTEVEVGNSSTVNVSLLPDDAQLNEVVIVGYGSIKKSELSGAVGSVKGEALQNLPIPSLDRAIQGRIAGVQVNANNGIPGGNTQVRIRGVGSVSGGNEPLYIVDGVQITAGERSRRIISSNPLNGINSNDIESIEVLKDAAAASIYGSQAANGVIIITTKKGKQGKGKFDVNYYYGQTDIIKNQPLLNSEQWINLYEEGQRNFYQSFDVFGEGFASNLARSFTQVNYGNAAAAATYDWQNLVSRRGDIQNIDISASGGNDKNRYFISGSFNKQNAQFIATDFTRASARLNFDNTLTSKLTAETRINLSTVTQNTQGVGGFNTNNALVGAIGRLPMANPFLSNGAVNPNLTYAIGPLGNLSNPLWLAQVNPQRGVTNQVLGTFALNYAINKDFLFRSSYSIEYSVIDENAFFDPRSPGGAGVLGSVQFLNTRVINWQTDQTLTYTKTFNNRHSISAIAGFSFRNQRTDGFNATGVAPASVFLNNTLVGTTANAVTSVFGQFKITGLFARVNYTLDDKYIFSATVRRDGSSRFGFGNSFGVFPAVSAAWNVHKENFFKNISIVNDLKVRASYGITGNQDLAFGLGAADFPVSLFGTAVAFGYGGAGGLGFTNLGNPQLRWEENRTLNFGLDFSMFNNRVTFTGDYFVRTTENLLLPQILPSTSGFGSIVENVGALENSGWELGITTTNLNGEFKWITDFNITFIKNKVTRLINPGEDLPNNGLWLGRPLGQVFVARYAGVNPADGRAMWYNQAGNITYDPQANDRIFLPRGSGSALLPVQYGGVTNTFTYKGIELVAFFQWNVGQLALSNFKANSSMDFRFDTNQDQDMLRRWQKPGDITDVPRIVPGAQEVGSANSLFGGSISGHDRFWEDASYIRLKQVTIAYNLPQSVIKRLKLNSVRIYAQGINLWTSTQFTGLDPEFAANTSNIGVLPPSKSIIGGIQFGF